MNKKNSLAFYTLIIVGLFSLFITNILAQATDSRKNEQLAKTCSGEKFVMPQTISLGNPAFENYLKTASLPRDERGKSFSKLPNEQKASFIKVNLALQFVKRPNMTKEQQEFVADAISKVSADVYDKSDTEKARLNEQYGREIENKAVGLFAYNELGDFIEPLMTDKDKETTLLQKYENLLKNGMQARKKLAKEMPVADRVKIWKTQLAYHLATSTFNKEQKEFIVALMPKIQSIFEASANLPEEEKTKYVEALESSMFKVFTKAEAYAVFMEIGIHRVVRDAPEFLGQFKAGNMGRNRAPFQTIKLSLSEIALNSLYWSCNCRWYCSQSGESCSSRRCERADYCGPFDEWECTGLCYRGQEEEL